MLKSSFLLVQLLAHILSNVIIWSGIFWVVQVSCYLHTRRARNTQEISEREFCRKASCTWREKNDWKMSSYTRRGRSRPIALFMNSAKFIANLPCLYINGHLLDAYLIYRVIIVQIGVENMWLRLHEIIWWCKQSFFGSFISLGANRISDDRILSRLC